MTKNTCFHCIHYEDGECGCGKCTLWDSDVEFDEDACGEYDEGENANE